MGFISDPTLCSTNTLGSVDELSRYGSALSTFPGVGFLIVGSLVELSGSFTTVLVGVLFFGGVLVAGFLVGALDGGFLVGGAGFFAVLDVGFLEEAAGFFVVLDVDFLVGAAGFFTDFFFGGGGQELYSQLAPRTKLLSSHITFLNSVPHHELNSPQISNPRYAIPGGRRNFTFAAPSDLSWTYCLSREGAPHTEYAPAVIFSSLYGT